MNLKFEAEQCGVKEAHKPHPWRNQDILVQCAGVMDRVNHPSHYNSHPSGIELIEVARHMNFNVGNAMKYMWRAGLKDEADISGIDKHIEDLEKAEWYLKDEIKRVKEQRKQHETGELIRYGVCGELHNGVKCTRSAGHIGPHTDPAHGGIVPPHITEKIEQHITDLNEQIIATAPEGIIYSGGPDTQAPIDWNIEVPAVKKMDWSEGSRTTGFAADS